MGTERYLSWKDLEEIGKARPFPKYERRATNSVVAPHLERRNPEGRSRPIISKNMVIHKPSSITSNLVKTLLFAAVVTLVIMIVSVAVSTEVDIFKDLVKYKDVFMAKVSYTYELVSSR